MNRKNSEQITERWNPGQVDVKALQLEINAYTPRGVINAVFNLNGAESLSIGRGHENDMVIDSQFVEDALVTVKEGGSDGSISIRVDRSPVKRKIGSEMILLPEGTTIQIAERTELYLGVIQVVFSPDSRLTRHQ